MTNELQLHAASPAELIEAHRNVFDIWSKGLPLDGHLRSRLESPKHRLATWYVGCLGGQVVVSLGSYPLHFYARQRVVPGFAIGSVYTVKEFRGRGFAPQLLAWVEQRERGRGAEIGLLYSDIDPDYYARLGYLRCPSLEGDCDLANASPPSGEAHQLVPIDPAEHLPTLARYYTADHGSQPLAIARDEAYWQALLRRFTEEQFYALVDAAGQWQGYARLGQQNDVWRMTDHALAEPTPQRMEALYGAALGHARKAGARRLGGWLPDTAAADRYFRRNPRKTEITMVKSLESSLEIDEEMVAAASRFCEIDHV